MRTSPPNAAATGEAAAYSGGIARERIAGRRLDRRGQHGRPVLREQAGDELPALRVDPVPHGGRRLPAPGEADGGALVQVGELRAELVLGLCPQQRAEELVVAVRPGLPGRRSTNTFVVQELLEHALGVVAPGELVGELDVEAVHDRGAEQERPHVRQAAAASTSAARNSATGRSSNASCATTSGSAAAPCSESPNRRTPTAQPSVRRTTAASS